jgi:hypothetical protein
METVIIRTAISFATDKTATCHFLKTAFSYTAPVVTDTGKNPFLFMSGLLEYHHLIAAGWALDLDESLGIVRDGVKPNGHGCTD